MMTCPLCVSKPDYRYTPIGSAIGLEVFVCRSCGFVYTTRSEEQSVYRPIESRNATLSCDADYSVGRVGKQQMTSENISFFHSELVELRPRSVLDMAAARGHFIRYVAQELKTERIVAIESDLGLLQGNLIPNQTEIIETDFRSIRLEEKFDLIYSCHTLEHYANPIPHLRFLKLHMHKQSLAIIDVPNLDSIRSTQPIDEYFYDKHRVYFDKDSLIIVLLRLGFKLIADRSSSASVKFLVGLADPKFKLHDHNPIDRFSENKNLIENYALRLKSNRQALPNAVSKLFEKMKPDQPTVIVGAGRILDAAIKYGHLKMHRFDYVTDNFLAETGIAINGVKIRRLDSLPRLENPCVVLFTRTATEALTFEIMKWNENAEIHTLSGLL